MKITKSRLKRLIKEELHMLGSLEIENNFIRKNLAHLVDIEALEEEQDWGGEGRRFDTDQMRSDFPLDSVEKLTDDHIEVAIRDAIEEDEDVDAFSAMSTMVVDMSNAEAVQEALEEDIDELWKVWEADAKSEFGF